MVRITAIIAPGEKLVPVVGRLYRTAGIGPYYLCVYDERRGADSLLRLSISQPMIPVVSDVLGRDIIEVPAGTSITLTQEKV